MVTVAQWEDLDKDGYPELIIAGDWMGIRLLKNDHARLTDISDKAGLTGLNGMWSSLTAADLDDDGDLDFVVGNCGYNNQFKASVKEPVRLYANDFDENGTIDPILCYYIQGKSYPMASKDELLDQIVPLRKKYIKYRDYANETIDDIFSAGKIRSAKLYHCEQLASCILYNNGGLQFSFKPLPLEAQFSRVYGVEVNDFDSDGTKDILLAGHFYPYRVQLGQSDASLGLLLKRKDKTSYQPVQPQESGCFIGGDVRSMVPIKDKAGNSYLFIGKNNSQMQVLKVIK